MGGVEAAIVSEMNVLGVIIDRRLTWSRHLQVVKQRVRGRLNLLKALCGPRCGANEKVLLQLHESFVLSVLESRVEAYSSTPEACLI